MPESNVMIIGIYLIAGLKQNWGLNQLKWVHHPENYTVCVVEQRGLIISFKTFKSNKSKIKTCCKSLTCPNRAHWYVYKDLRGALKNWWAPAVQPNSADAFSLFVFVSAQTFVWPHCVYNSSVYLLCVHACLSFFCTVLVRFIQGESTAVNVSHWWRRRGIEIWDVCCVSHWHIC